jgi:hypothetical protein
MQHTKDRTHFLPLKPYSHTGSATALGATKSAIFAWNIAAGLSDWQEGIMGPSKSNKENSIMKLKSFLLKEPLQGSAKRLIHRTATNFSHLLTRCLALH